MPRGDTDSVPPLRLLPLFRGQAYVLLKIAEEVGFRRAQRHGGWKPERVQFRPCPFRPAGHNVLPRRKTRPERGGDKLERPGMGGFDFPKPDADIAVAVEKGLKPGRSAAGRNPRRRCGDGNRRGDGEQESTPSSAGCGKAGVSHLMHSCKQASVVRSGVGNVAFPCSTAPAVAEG